MNGAESLIKTLVDSGVEICFTNPGTSEMHFVAALDEVEGMRCVLCLFEGVVSGAADGYARMARKPASTLLHLGPGLGNALANIHNARKGNQPMVNIVGDHATYHLQYDAPLTSDIEGIAGPVSHWVHTSGSAERIAEDAARAVEAAGNHRVATLILPADVSWSDNPHGANRAARTPPRRRVPDIDIAGAADMLRSGKRCMVMAGGGEVTAEHGELLSRLGKATGARVGTDTFPPRIARGAGRAKLERLPYLAELAIDHIKDIECLILVGCKPPVSFFAYPNVPSTIAPAGCEELTLAVPGDDMTACLTDLLAAAGGPDTAPDLHPLAPQGRDQLLPVGLEVPRPPRGSDALRAATRADDSRVHWGVLASGVRAVGAALACPDRKVVCLEGDGSAMYTISALWTMARENLDVTVVIFNNRKYSILELEFSRTGARGGTPGPKAASMLDVGTPDMDFVAMAQGMGVTAVRATTAEEFNEQFAAAMERRGPRLIDAIIPTAWS